MTQNSKRIPGLDVVRAIAVLLVVGAHSYNILDPLLGMPAVAVPVSFIGDHIRPLAGLGVELFFVLSGFLIGNILIREFMKPGDFTFTQVRRFWVRRWFRTLPNYWLILSANIILYSALHLHPFNWEQVKFYFFAQNLVHPIAIDFFNESWSLSVEEWFYLSLPLVMMVSSVVLRVRNKQKFLAGIFAGYLVFFVIVRFVNAFAPVNGLDQDSGIRKVVLFRLDAVMFGVLFAYLNIYKEEQLRKYRRTMLLISLIGGGLLYYITAKRSLQITLSPVPVVRFMSDAFLYMVQPLILSMCLPWAAGITTMRNKVVATTAAFISKISYSMYLVHYSLIFLPFFYHIPTTSAMVTIGCYLLYWVIVIGLSAGIYRYFELPVMNLRDRVAAN